MLWFNGGSKPPPYTVKLNYKVNTRLLSDLKIYATVGTGLAPVHKKYILNQINGQPHFQPPLCKGRWVAVGNSKGLWGQFYKNPSVIFLFQKNDSSLYKGAFVGQGQTLSLHYWIYNLICAKYQLLTPHSTLLTPQRFYHRFIGQDCFLNAARNST